MTAILAATPTATAATEPTLCAGECDGNDQVTVDEVVKLVNIALGDADPTSCAGGIPDGQVDVAVIIEAVNNALNGCG